MNVLAPGTIVTVKPGIVAIGLKGQHFYLQMADEDGVTMYDTEVTGDLDDEGNFMAKVIGPREEETDV